MQFALAAQHQAAQTAGSQAALASALSSQRPPSVVPGAPGKLYHVPRTLGKRLAKMATDGVDDATAELRCEHERLRAGAESRLVGEETWRLVGQVFGRSQPLVDGDDAAMRCTICADAMRKVAEVSKTEKAERQTKRARLQRLLDDEMPLSLCDVQESVPPPEANHLEGVVTTASGGGGAQPVLYMVCSEWLQLWRESMRDKKATVKLGAAGPINAACALCDHRLLRVRPSLCRSWRKLEQAYGQADHDPSAAEAARDDSLGAQIRLVTAAEAVELACGASGALEELPACEYVGGAEGRLGQLRAVRPIVCDQGCADEALSKALAEVTGFEEQLIYIHKAAQRPTKSSGGTSVESSSNNTIAPAALVDGGAAADAAAAVAMASASRRSRRSSGGADFSLRVSGGMSVNNLKLMLFHAHEVAPSQQRLYFGGSELVDSEATLADAGVVPRSKMVLWVDTSVAADAEEAMALLSQQSAEEKTGKPRRAEDGFLGSALIGSSLPAPVQ